MKIKVIIVILTVLGFGALAIFLKQCVVFTESPKMAGIRLMSGKWESTFSNQVSMASQMEIIQRDNDKTLFSTTDKNEIAELIELIEIDEAESGNYCFCGGTLLFVFSEGTNELVSAGFHHGTSFRWHHGMWPGDASLNERAMINISNWLGLRNIKIKE